MLTIPYLPMVAETNVRQGFLTDDQYTKLRDALPEYLRPLFVTAYFTGVRLGELLSIEWRRTRQHLRRYNSGQCWTNLAAVRFSRAACALG